jgi:hypothetical protein
LIRELQELLPVVSLPLGAVAVATSRTMAEWTEIDVLRFGVDQYPLMMYVGLAYYDAGDTQKYLPDKDS